MAWFPVSLPSGPLLSARAPRHVLLPPPPPWRMPSSMPALRLPSTERSRRRLATVLNVQPNCESRVVHEEAPGTRNLIETGAVSESPVSQTNVGGTDGTEFVDDAGVLEQPSYVGSELADIYATCKFWEWRGYSVNYAVQGIGSPVLLVHGFGASVGHWRRNIKVLSKRNRVYAIDLLGLGASEKPEKFKYTMETWAEMLLDFLNEIIKEPTVLVGNSIGSLLCLMVTADAPCRLLRGTVLLNCAGGMNNKALIDDWRMKLFLPLLWLIDFLLIQPVVASWLFKRIQSRENLRNVLLSVYHNKDAVDDELIEVIRKPAEDPGALDSFVAVVTGPPGPSPRSLMPKISTQVLVLWGDKDPFTPIDGPVGKYFSGLSSVQPNVTFFILQGVGHCPHDDRPDLVHEKLLPWLSSLPL